MPTGLPSISAIVDQAAEVLSATSAYLQIPPYETYIDACKVAAKDICTTTKSSWHLLVLTLTPLVIILKLLTHFFLMAVGIITEHTIKHGFVAAREGCIQARTGLSWFVAWQRSLGNAAVAMELCIVAACVGLYMLRRYIQKYKYIERTQRWFERKRKAAIKRYDEAVQTVSETSVLLALLLPHLLYVVGVVTLKCAAPWLLRYFAIHAPVPTTAIISLWIPLVRTVSFLHRWKGNASEDAEEKDGEKDETDTTTTTRKRTTRLSTGKVADRYVQATMKSTGNATSTTKKQLESMSADQALRAEGMDLLQYWVVNALLYAFFRAVSVLPVVRNLVTAAATTAPKTASRWAAPSKPGRISALTSSLRPTEQFLKETKLIFYIWLLYLPTSLTGAAVTKKSTKGKLVKKRVSSWETKIGSGDLNRPINILYKRFAPIAVSVAVSSVQLTQEGEPSQSGKQSSIVWRVLAGLMTKVIGSIRSVLDVIVFTRIISPSTRDWIVSAIVDGAALLPAAIPLVMPRYFTQFGVLYVSNVVPAANSSIAIDAKEGTSMARYLRYWVIHTLLSCLLESFRPVLAWVPLSTHATLILWAYLQLKPVTETLFALFEWELTAFGLLHAQKDTKDGDTATGHDIDKTLTVQLLRKASSMLPKAGNTQQDESETNNSGETEKKEWEMVQEREGATCVIDQLHHAKVD